jgi:hypothetical protein
MIEGVAPLPETSGFEPQRQIGRVDPLFQQDITLHQWL